MLRSKIVGILLVLFAASIASTGFAETEGDVKGSRIGKKLVGWQATEIREKRKQNGTHAKVLAREYDLAVQTIYDILARKIWKDVP